MDDLDCFGIGPVTPNPNPLVRAFLWHKRDDGWEKVLFGRAATCGYCGRDVKVGWLEMECEAIRCAECVPPVRELQEV
jgi:hypothetical protein